MITIKGPRKELNEFIAHLSFSPAAYSPNASMNNFSNTGYIGKYYGIPIVVEESLRVENDEDLGLPKDVKDFINSSSPASYFCRKELEETIKDLKEQLWADKLKDEGWGYDPYGNQIPPEESW